MIPLSVFIVTIILNFCVIIFGKESLQKNVKKVPIKIYFNNLLESVDESIGKHYAFFLYICLIILSLLLMLFNILLLIECVIAVIFGMFITKKIYQTSFINNHLNKLIIYIKKKVK